VSTRDFLRSELSRLAEELDEAAQRRQRLDRKERQKDVKRASKKADDALEQPLDDAAVEAEAVDAYEEEMPPRSGSRRGR
jgi:hypothetical protein